MLLVVVRHEFGFVSSHVNIDRTLAFASLAAQTEVEGFLNVLVLPPGFQFFALQHLKEKMSASTRGVLLFQGHHVARTHHAFILPSALANSDATHRAVPKVTFIFRKLEMSFRFPGLEVRSEAQILVNEKWIDDFTRIHLVLRIPDGLELAKCLYQLGTEHFRQHFGF